MNNYLITVLGPTAIGKTTLAIKLAKAFKTEIISSDSRQYFKEMNLGTAVPSKEELGAVTHHFIQDRSIHDDYNVGQFERDALAKLHNLFKKNQYVVMVGGSGLYIDAVLNGLDDFPKVDKQIRKQLKIMLADKGLGALQVMLKKQDAITYKQIDIQNAQRVIRALEICIGTGMPYSSYLNQNNTHRNFIPIKIGLEADREILYDRINKRVDKMMADGLFDEAKYLFKFKELNALQTVGYKELFKVITGEWSREFAVSEIKKNTRRFAKRQGTWFRKDEQIKWFDFQTNPAQIITYINSVK